MPAILPGMSVTGEDLSWSLQSKLSLHSAAALSSNSCQYFPVPAFNLQCTVSTQMCASFCSFSSYSCWLIDSHLYIHTLMFSELQFSRQFEFHKHFTLPLCLRVWADNFSVTTFLCRLVLLQMMISHSSRYQILDGWDLLEGCKRVPFSGYYNYYLILTYLQHVLILW